MRVVADGTSIGIIRTEQCLQDASMTGPGADMTSATLDNRKGPDRERSEQRLQGAGVAFRGVSHRGRAAPVIIEIDGTGRDGGEPLECERCWLMTSSGRGWTATNPAAG